jgi:hypothetical protein
MNHDPPTPKPRPGAGPPEPRPGAGGPEPAAEPPRPSPPNPWVAPPEHWQPAATSVATATTVVERTGPPPPLMFLLGLLFGAIIGFAIGLVLWHTGGSTSQLVTTTAALCPLGLSRRPRDLACLRPGR